MAPSEAEFGLHTLERDTPEEIGKAQYSRSENSQTGVLPVAAIYSLSLVNHQTFKSLDCCVCRMGIIR